MQSTHFGLLTLYGDVILGQYCLGQWSVRTKQIHYLNHADLSLKGLCDIHLRAVSQLYNLNLICNKRSEITALKLLPQPPSTGWVKCTLVKNSPNPIVVVLICPLSVPKCNVKWRWMKTSDTYVYWYILTHLSRVPHTYVSQTCQHWLR